MLNKRRYQRVLSGSFFYRVSVAIQFTSQVLPPSSENACSKWADVGVISEMTNRTRMAIERLLIVELALRAPRAQGEVRPTENGSLRKARGLRRRGDGRPLEALSLSLCRPLVPLVPEAPRRHGWQGRPPHITLTPGHPHPMPCT